MIKIIIKIKNIVNKIILNPIKARLEIKKKYNDWKTHTAKRYASGVESIQAGTISREDLDILIQYEPSVLKTIQFLYHKQEQERTKENYGAIINRENDITLIDLDIEKAEQEYAVLEEELRKVSMYESYSYDQIVNKRIKIDTLYKRLQLTENYITNLHNIKESLAPPRKRGRPKKEPTKTMAEKIEETTAVIDSLNENQIEEQLFVEIKDLTKDKKLYLLNYVKNMKEVGEAIKENIKKNTKE